MEDLELKLKQTELNNYILEEENSLLRENVQCLLGDLEHLREVQKNVEKEKEEIEKIKCGKIYKILVKLKKLIK